MYTFKNKISKKINKEKQVEILKNILTEYKEQFSDVELLDFETVLYSLIASSTSSTKPKGIFE